MKTVTGKDYHGSWTSKTQIDLPDDRVLQISTSKKSGGQLSTYATVHKMEGTMMSHMMFHDYSRQLIVENTRCTEKNVRAQHGEAMKLIDQVLEEVDAKYYPSKISEVA